MKLFNRLTTVIAETATYLQYKLDELASYFERKFRIWGLPAMVLIIIIFLMKNEGF